MVKICDGRKSQLVCGEALIRLTFCSQPSTRATTEAPSQPLQKERADGDIKTMDWSRKSTGAHFPGEDLTPPVPHPKHKLYVTAQVDHN